MNDLKFPNSIANCEILAADVGLRAFLLWKKIPVRTRMVHSTGATENIVERLSSVQSWSRFCLSWQRNAREQLRTVYTKELTQQLVKNNFFVLPVCLSELLPFAALNSTCMSARILHATRLYGCTHNLFRVQWIVWIEIRPFILLVSAFLFYCVSIALWVVSNLSSLHHCVYDCVLYIPCHISSSALHGVMAFGQGVSEGMGSAPPSLQLRSFTSLFPLAGLYLASGNILRLSASPVDMEMIDCDGHRSQDIIGQQHFVRRK
eukprot:scaffold170755_cov78-Cyclotella_meneghiniana.AAC.1